MKDQDQNLAVAKFHGWTEIRHNPKTDLWYGKPPKDRYPWDVVIPDYGNDLNAMHQVEMMVDMHSPNKESRDRGLKYCRHLGRIGESHGWKGLAPAHERREALLRTLSLWTDD